MAILPPDQSVCLEILNTASSNVQINLSNTGDTMALKIFSIIEILDKEQSGSLFQVVDTH